MAGNRIITFLDNDHILRLVAMGLGARDAAAEAYARGLFAPDPLDIDAVRALAHGLSAAEGVEVRQAVPPTPEAVAGSTILLSRRGTVSAEMIAACPDLALIQRLGERADGLALSSAAARGIAVSCLPRPSMAFTAEHALLLMLALEKKLLAADALVRRGGWDASKVRPSDDVAYNWAGVPDVGGLAGKTLGLIGLGEVGTLIVRRAAAFGMRLLYHNRNRLPAGRERALAVEYATTDTLLNLSDHIVLAAANLPANIGLIGADAFAAMRPTAFFINISRGRMVDEDALYNALVRKRIAGAGLDVHAIEPRAPGDRFALLENVVLTPHIAGGSRRHLLREVAQIYENCRAALSGRPPPFGLVSASAASSPG